MDASFLSIVFLEWEHIYVMKNNFLLGYFENLKVDDVIFIRMRLCLENTASIKFANHDWKLNKSELTNKCLCELNQAVIMCRYVYSLWFRL